MGFNRRRGNEVTKATDSRISRMVSSRADEPAFGNILPSLPLPLRYTAAASFMLRSETFKASMARFDRWVTWLGIPCGFVLLVPVLVGIKVLFWSLLVLKLDT